MPSVFTLEAPTGFGDPQPSPDYLELLSHYPGQSLPHDRNALYERSGGSLSGAGIGGATEFFRDRGLVLGTLMAFGASIVVGAVVGQTFVWGLDKLRTQ